MRKNLKDTDFLASAGILILAVKNVLEKSTDISSSVLGLVMFAWGVLYCIRADEKNHKDSNNKL